MSANGPTLALIGNFFPAVDALLAIAAPCDLAHVDAIAAQLDIALAVNDTRRAAAVAFALGRAVEAAEMKAARQAGAVASAAARRASAAHRLDVWQTWAHEIWAGHPNLSARRVAELIVARIGRIQDNQSISAKVDTIRRAISDIR